MSKRCNGCGVILQDRDINMDGYTTDINYDICQRCFMIKNYGRSKDTMKNNDDYLSIFNQIKDNDLVVYVSSVLTLNMDYIDRFKNVVLVITKWDIIPKAVKEGKIINYIKKRYSNIQEVVIVSANKNHGLDELYRVLNSRNSKGDNIYFVGITNSGKSTLLNAMIKSYSGMAGGITTSNYPSTTLGVVEAKVGDIIIKDTPGMLVSDSIINFLNDKEIKRINTKKEIKPITFQVKGVGAKLIDEMIRIEYDTNMSSMTFYMTNNLNIKTISMNNPRLIDGEIQEFILNDNMDLVIEDIGFIKCTKAIKIRVYTDKKIMIRVRDNLI
jgi:hypothetical protein